MFLKQQLSNLATFLKYSDGALHVIMMIAMIGFIGNKFDD